jgi:hypothetical protein
LGGKVARCYWLNSRFIHIIRYAYQEPWQYFISLEDMESEIKMGYVLTNHALAVFELSQQDGAQQIARMIYQWIKRSKFQVFTRRELQRNFRRLKKDDILPAFEMLKEMAILRKLKGNGKCTYFAFMVF